MLVESAYLISIRVLSKAIKYASIVFIFDIDFSSFFFFFEVRFSLGLIINYTFKAFVFCVSSSVSYKVSVES